eukprot:8881780-Pyramimonas_sp.AAC.1
MASAPPAARRALRAGQVRGRKTESRGGMPASIADRSPACRCQSERAERSQCHSVRVARGTWDFETSIQDQCPSLLSALCNAFALSNAATAV